MLKFRVLVLIEYREDLAQGSRGGGVSAFVIIRHGVCFSLESFGSLLFPEFDGIENLSLICGRASRLLHQGIPSNVAFDNVLDSF